MIEQERENFESLRSGSCVSDDYVRGYYGLSWPLPDDIRQDLETWLAPRPKKRHCGDSEISRYALEEFMQQKRVLPKKWMAARLGMETRSLEELLASLQEIGMRPQRYAVYSEFVAEELEQDIVPSLPRGRFLTFADHNSFCERLHKDLAEVLNINVHPLFCATSDQISQGHSTDEYPRQFAKYFDCITLKPLSPKHQMWLDFRKPLNLSPDRCSKLFYVENRDTLRQFNAGSQEPEDLSYYEQFLAGQESG